MSQALELNPPRKLGFGFILLTILLLAVYFQVIIGLVSDWWTDSNYSHGFLVPLITLFLIWKKRNQLKAIKKEKSHLGFIIFLAGLFIYVIGTAGAEYFSVRFSLVMVIFGLLLYFFGKEFIKQIWFAIFFLLFMIPIPYVIYYALAFPMQMLSTKVSVFALHLVGVPALREGNIIYLPGDYALEVAEACSGLRSLVSLLALGALLAYLLQKSKTKQMILFLSTVPIAIVANFFRVFLTAVGAYAISIKLAESFLHEVSGIFVFLISTLLLLGVSLILSMLNRKELI
ncbi:MAG: exosortase [candidate division Zixibacteria bacterium]|nr:exosortase [candidate division Zixibacteria bacterium]